VLMCLLLLVDVFYFVLFILITVLINADIRSQCWEWPG